MIFRKNNKNNSIAEKPIILWFQDITDEHFSLVGGKNSSLAKMYQKLSKKGVAVPPGFTVTTEVYWNILAQDNIKKQIKDILHDLHVEDVEALKDASQKIRRMIQKVKLPKKTVEAIQAAYEKLSSEEKQKNISVAVRSSATAEDLPDASFAGQQETFLNISGSKDLQKAIKKCVSSLFTPRAISYRDSHGYDHLSVGLSVTVQKMVDATKAASGVMFTLDTETGFDGVVLINATYGLGEYVVKGKVIPDQFFIFKKGILAGKTAIISRTLGRKQIKLGTTKNGVKQYSVSKKNQKEYAVTDDDIVQLSKWAILIEELYGTPQDIEWVKDGKTGKLYIVQARPETVTVKNKANSIEKYSLRGNADVIIEGTAIGQKIGSGKARVISSPKQMKYFKKGEVLIAKNTDPDWEPLMRVASAIVTEGGGKTSHAAIVSRELGVPCIVGAKGVMKKIKTGSKVTVVCSLGHTGHVYKGLVSYEVKHVPIGKAPATKTKVMMNVADPDNAFSLAHLPHDGIGLAREEFIISNFVRVHPLALVNYDTLKDKKAKKQIKRLTSGYKKKTDYFVDKLSEGIARIAVSAYPKEVVVRLSDFKSNEYARLIGGAAFEPDEKNPMLGWRGASRYYSKAYRKAFKLECESLKRVRDEWGLDNVIIMIPFCRTPEEGRKVLSLLKKYGLERGKNGLKIYVMCEIPSNVVLAKDFAKLFDGFSIGSNDLTQLSLGVDRDSAEMQSLYDEKDETVKQLIKSVIRVAHKNKTTIGFCGQAPSDSPKFADFLIKQGIDSISLNPDTLITGRRRVARVEKKIGKQPNHLQKWSLGLVTAFGCVAAMFIGVGAGCTPETLSQRSLQKEAEHLGVNLQQSPADLREKIEQKVRTELTKAVAGQKVTFTENTLLGMTLSFPSEIQITTIPTGLELKNIKTNQVAQITRSVYAYAIPSTTEIISDSIAGVSSTMVTLPAAENKTVTIMSFVHPTDQEVQIISEDSSFITTIASYISFLPNAQMNDLAVLGDVCINVPQYFETDTVCQLHLNACQMQSTLDSCDPNDS